MHRTVRLLSHSASSEQEWYHFNRLQQPFSVLGFLCMYNRYYISMLCLLWTCSCVAKSGWDYTIIRRIFLPTIKTNKKSKTLWLSSMKRNAFTLRPLTTCLSKPGCKIRPPKPSPLRAHSDRWGRCPSSHRTASLCHRLSSIIMA